MDWTIVFGLLIGVIVGTALFIYGAWAWCRFNM